LSDPYASPPGTSPPAALKPLLARESARAGLASAWNAHFPALVHAHSSGSLPPDQLGEMLYASALADPNVRPHLAERPDTWEARLGADFKRVFRDLIREHGEALAGVREGDGTPMMCVRNAAFQNWGRTVMNVPSITCVPKTKTGVCNLVKWAAANGKSVRVAGYRHTWTDLYSSNDQVLVSLLPLDVVEDLPAREPGIDPTDELQGIQIVGSLVENGVTKALCRIGAATTNEQFRRWCLDPKGGNWAWTVPLNVIMVEITWGGSNAPICHGAGWRHRTLSDLVAAIEFVNPNGELQVVDDPDLLTCAAGCFGLLGVVTAITLKLDPMSFAVMKPSKPRIALTIPPPKGFTVPAGIDMTGITQVQMDAAWSDFVTRCETDYYSEWFWFPYQQECWVNSWTNDGRREDAKPYPGDWGTWIEEAEEYLAQLLNNSLFKLLPGRLQAELLAGGAMAALPSGSTLVTPLIEALHFRRGIQNMRVLDMELEIPIPPRADDPTKPDWTVCQRAWWAVLLSIYQRSDAPMRVALEMRIMADSGMLMAPQFGNRFGTCSIEVLTNLNVTPEEWLGFMQQVADAWDSFTDPNGARLNVRPHWAKQWQGLSFRGLPVTQYLKQIAYAETIPHFKARLERIAQAGGYTIADLQKRFSNPVLNDLFESVFS